MKTLRTLTLSFALMLGLPMMAQDFGYPKDKAFYKAHWNEVLSDLGPDAIVENAQYLLHDFNKDGKAELYVWLGNRNAYLYSAKNNKVVRVSETARPVEDEFWLGSFYPHFMAPWQMLVDKPVKKEVATEQHFYSVTDLPEIWFRLDPVVQGTFNIKTAMDAVVCFDCEYVGDAVYELCHNKSSVDAEEFVVDVANGYAKYKFKSDTMNEVEFCYWNMAEGQKLLAMHVHVSSDYGNGMEFFEQTFFMKYNPKTKHLVPIVAPIQGFDFQKECNIALPRKGKNIKLIAAEDEELKWTGNGFKK